MTVSLWTSHRVSLHLLKIKDSPHVPLLRWNFYLMFFSPLSKTLHRTGESVYLYLCARCKGEWQQGACWVSSEQRMESCVYTIWKKQLWGARWSHAWQKSYKQRREGGTIQVLRMWQGRRAVLKPRLEEESHGWQWRTVRVPEVELHSAPAIHVWCQWRTQAHHWYLNGSAFGFPPSVLCTAMSSGTRDTFPIR